jgi:hypothetical protein
MPPARSMTLIWPTITKSPSTIRVGYIIGLEQERQAFQLVFGLQSGKLNKEHYIHFKV